MYWLVHSYAFNQSLDQNIGGSVVQSLVIVCLRRPET